MCLDVHFSMAISHHFFQKDYFFENGEAMGSGHFAFGIFIYNAMQYSMFLLLQGKKKHSSTIIDIMRELASGGLHIVSHP